MILTCPHCLNDEQDKILGHEVPGVYDGTLFWSCFNCGLAWPRDFGDWHNRTEQAQLHASKFNDARKASVEAHERGPAHD